MKSKVVKPCDHIVRPCDHEELKHWHKCENNKNPHFNVKCYKFSGTNNVNSGVSGFVGEIPFEYSGPLLHSDNPPSPVCNGEYQYFAGEPFKKLPLTNTDMIHVWDNGDPEYQPMFVFAKKIKSFYLYLRPASPNDPDYEFIDFKEKATCITGNILFDGTAFVPENLGGEETGGVVYVEAKKPKDCWKFSDNGTGGTGCNDIAILLNL